MLLEVTQRNPLVHRPGLGWNLFFGPLYSWWAGTSVCLPRKSSFFPFHHCYTLMTAVATRHASSECEVCWVIFLSTGNNLKSPGNLRWSTVSSDGTAALSVRITLTNGWCARVQVTADSPIPGQVVLDCARKLAEHEPESKAISGFYFSVFLLQAPALSSCANFPQRWIVT